MRQRLCYRMDLALVALLVLLVVKQAHASAHTFNSMYRKVIHGGACSLVVNRSQWHHVHIGTSEESQIQSCQHLNSVHSSASKLLKLLLFVRCLRVLRSSPLATPHHTEPCPYHMFALSHLPYNTYHYNHRHCSICTTVATTLQLPYCHHYTNLPYYHISPSNISPPSPLSPSITITPITSTMVKLPPLFTKVVQTSLPVPL